MMCHYKRHCIINILTVLYAVLWCCAVFVGVGVCVFRQVGFHAINFLDLLIMSTGFSISLTVFKTKRGVRRYFVECGKTVLLIEMVYFHWISLRTFTWLSTDFRYLLPFCDINWSNLQNDLLCLIFKLTTFSWSHSCVDSKHLFLLSLLYRLVCFKFVSSRRTMLSWSFTWVFYTGLSLFNLFFFSISYLSLILRKCNVLK